MNHQPTYLTSAGLDKLKDELRELKNARRPQVIERIREAVSHGDLSENSEYEDAKNEQGFIEGRIVELEKMLAGAKIVQSGKSNGEVSLGSNITLKHNGKSSSFTIVGPAEADPGSGLISNESPLGQALLGKKVSEKTAVTTPKGEMHYQIVAIK